MNICIVGAGLNPPFIEAQKKLALELSRQLARNGHVVHVVTESSVTSKREKKVDGIFFHRYQEHMCPPAFAKTIVKLNRYYKFDIIHNQNLTIKKSNLLMSRPLRKLGVPILSYFCLEPSLGFGNWVRLVVNDPKDGLMRMLEFNPRSITKLQLASAGKIVTSSNFLKRRLLETWHDQENVIEVIYPFIDVREFERQKASFKTMLDVRDTDKLLLFIGTHCIFRGETDFLEATSIVLRDFPDAKAVLVVPEPIPERIWSTISKLGIQKSVKFVRGHIDIAKVMSACDVYVFAGLSSVGGGSIDPPLTIIESLAAGTPCVAYNTGGIDELPKGRRLIRLVEPSNIRALAESITEALTDGTREEGGETLVGSVFDSEIAAGRFLSIYKKLAG